jgi:hypothetical protein
MSSSIIVSAKLSLEAFSLQFTTYDTSTTQKLTNHVLFHESSSQLSLFSAIAHFCSSRTGTVPIKSSTVCPCSLATETNAMELVHFNELYQLRERL